MIKKLILFLLIFCVPLEGYTLFDVFIESDVAKAALLAAVSFGSFFGLKKIYDVVKLKRQEQKDKNFQDFYEAFRGDDLNQASKFLQSINNVDIQKKEQELLNIALEKDSIPMLNMLIQKGVDINVEDEESKTFLYKAIDKNRFNIVKKLLDENVNIKPNDFFVAIINKNFEIAKMLIASKPILKFKKLISERYAFYDSEMLSFLITNKVININDEITKKILRGAIENSEIEVVKLLIQSQIKVNVECEDDNTFLHEAIKKGDIQIVELLIKGGAYVNAQDGYSESPLFIAIENNDAEIIELLIKSGANVNARDECGDTALFVAVVNDDIDIVTLLIDAGADVDAQDECGDTPLFAAIERNDIEIVELLLKKGVKINVQNECGNAPLYEAIKKNNIEIVKLLVEHNADVNVKNKKDYTPLCKAIKYSYIEIVEFLLKRGAEVNVQDKQNKTLLYKAIKERDIDIVKLLIKSGVEINFQNEEQKTSLYRAIKNSDVEMVEFLIENRVDVNAKVFFDVEDYQGENVTTPLGLALYLYMEEDQYDAKTIKYLIIKLLINAGADVNDKALFYEDGDGIIVTPLGFALAMDDDNGMKYKIIQLLIDAGADVNADLIFDEENDEAIVKALEVALDEDGNDEIRYRTVKLLIEAGADVNIDALFLNAKVAADNANALFFVGDDDNRDSVNIMKVLEYAFIMKNENESKYRITKLLIDAGACIHGMVGDDSKVFYQVAKNGDIKNLILLLIEESMPQDQSLKVASLCDKKNNKVPKLAELVLVNVMNNFKSYEYVNKNDKKQAFKAIIAGLKNQYKDNPLIFSLINEKIKKALCSEIFDIDQRKQNILDNMKRLITRPNEENETVLDIAQNKKYKDLSQLMQRVVKAQTFSDLPLHVKSRAQESMIKQYLLTTNSAENNNNYS